MTMSWVQICTCMHTIVWLVHFLTVASYHMDSGSNAWDVITHLIRPNRLSELLKVTPLSLAFHGRCANWDEGRQWLSITAPAQMHLTDSSNYEAIVAGKRMELSSQIKSCWPGQCRRAMHADCDGPLYFTYFLSPWGWVLDLWISSSSNVCYR